MEPFNFISSASTAPSEKPFIPRANRTTAPYGWAIRKKNLTLIKFFISVDIDINHYINQITVCQALRFLLTPK